MINPTPVGVNRKAVSAEALKKINPPNERGAGHAPAPKLLQKNVEVTMHFYWYTRADWPENLYRDLFWINSNPKDYPAIPEDFEASLEYVLLATMSQREALAIKYRYKNRETYATIGDELGVTHGRVRQILSKAICKLRHPLRSQVLRYGIAELMNQHNNRCRVSVFEEGYQKGFHDTGPIKREMPASRNPYGVPNIMSVGSVDKISIDELDLSVRTYNGLWRANLKTIGDVMTKSKQDILGIRNIGQRSLRELEEKLQKYDVQLREK